MWNDLSFDTYFLIYLSLSKYTTNNSSACEHWQQRYCLLKVRASFAEIPAAEQHLPSAARLPLYTGRRWDRDAAGPLQLPITPATDAEARTDRRSHFTWCEMPHKDHEQIWGLCCKRMGRYLPQNRSGREQDWLDPLSWAYADKPPTHLRCTIANTKTSLGTRPLDTTFSLLHTKFISSHFLVLQRKVEALKHGIN